MAHASVISLKHTIQRLLDFTNLPIASSLHRLEEILPHLDGPSRSRSKRSAIIALEAEIKEAAWKLEDVLESYALHRSTPPPQDLAGFPADEKTIEEATSSFFEAAEKLKELHEQLLKEEEEEEDDETDDDDGTDDFAGKNSTTIGFSDQFEKITNELLDGRRGLKSVSIVGMAGIGKTHLAREIIQHETVARNFDLILLVRVGQKAEIEDVVVDIVAQVEFKARNLYLGKDLSELMELLQKYLNGRSYLIVLDDIWSTDFLDFWMTWVRPYGKQKKRLLLTTRLEDVGKSHNTKIHRVRFLDNEESWKLLRQNVFGDDYLPPELEEVGKKIAEYCEGLPLLILVIASILRLEEKTEEHWKKVANKKTTTFTDAYDMISKRLFSSYEHLPSHLKPCFLYMGVFPQTFKIPVPKLVNLWIVEDFLDLYNGRNLEDLGMEYMKELVSNSLVIVCKRGCSPASKIKSSKLHSAYWYLCVKEARKDKLFHALNKLTDAAEECIEKQRRLAVQTNLLFGIKEVHESIAAASTARSLLCTGEDQQYPVPICYNLMLLRVLDALAIRLYDFPEEVVKLLLLRYLSVTHNGKVPPSISHLQKLQCLVIRQHHNIKILRDSSPKWWECEPRGLRYSTSLPEELWDMQELKHIRILGRNLPNPGFSKRLLKLSTLYVNAHSCSRGVFRSIPNLAKLGIEIELRPDFAETLNCLKHVNLLRRLESLKCFVLNPFSRSRFLAPPHHLSNLPTSLKKLSLNGLGYPWKSMSRIGSLPNLEVLKLRCSAFQGPEWEAEAGEFPSLQLILLEDMDLVQWTIYNGEWLPSFQRQICGDDYLSRFGKLMKRLVYNERCFRRLQRLIFRHCYRLKEIPLEIWEIPTMERIEVVDCSTSAVASALLLKERNSSIEVEISSSSNRR